MKTYQWTTDSGKTIELRARCVVTMADDIRDSDGWEINMGKKESTEAMLEAYVDGVKIDSCWNTAFWSTISITKMPGYKRIWGIEKVAFTTDRAVEIDVFLKSVIAEGTEPAVVETQTAAAKAAKAEKIESAKSVVSASKTTVRNPDGTLMTRAQSSTWKHRYNQINNECGEGFVPEVVTVEDVAWANSVLQIMEV